ncbi:NAD(P)-binding domain-containing protein [Streptomyces sp. NBC_01803]|uniref:NAD(P)-binding domain-containing protein n=1 Tax=Streptomyces sp. NBC_01803 TaxID=2975946 RepID=UPI002DDBCA6E|nr:NAD(P)-binding domain-containing protein [Streptomyces sp. NBC_01803]WSA45247.1 lysine N(6)-hydroxylase/L-ornithine N(5)-oxygenase family protein [Streptomyces sp. NBC_01803]
MHDLVVVGAGPYGLSIAAHAAAAGLDTRVFGRPMASWRDHMPAGMFLKSEPWATDLSEPTRERTLAAYCAAHDVRPEHGVPLPVDAFARYGLWFAERLTPPVEEREIIAVAPHADGFEVKAVDGERLAARNVALAVGVMPFVHLPGALRGLPAELVSHSSDHRDLGRFRGADVTVVGAGQAALETAALLAEAGARPTVVARAGGLRWDTPPAPLRRGGLAGLRAPHSGLGTGWTTWVWSELPWAVRRLPEAVRAHIVATALGPAGAWWLRERFEGVVPVRLGLRLLRAEPSGAGVRLTVASAGGRPEVIETGHVIAATGFVPDLRRLDLLDRTLRDGLRTVRGTRAPALSGGFESSRAGLFFAGLLSAPSFGPAMRFVHGVSFTAGRLTRSLRDVTGQRPAAAPRMPGQGTDRPVRPAGAAR